MHTSTLIFRISLAVLLLAGSLSASARKTRIHSHNDYEQERPFWGAYEAGAASIEADIWLVDGILHVAHNRKDISPNRLLKDMYLEPIRQVMERNGGKAYPKGKPLQLLVDLKSDASTLDALISLIREGGYTACFNVKDNPNAVQIVITGDKVKKEHFCNYPDFIFFDGLPHIDYTPEERKRVPMVSAHYGKFTKWKGKGQMDKADQKRIKEAVRKAHKAGSKFRLWAFPDNEDAWEMTRKLGMDFINTDHPDRVAKTLH